MASRTLGGVGGGEAGHSFLPEPYSTILCHILYTRFFLNRQAGYFWTKRQPVGVYILSRFFYVKISVIGIAVFDARECGGGLYSVSP